MPDAVDKPGLSEPDIRHEGMFGSVQSLVEIEKIYMGGLPFSARLRNWRDLKRRGEISSAIEGLRMLMPSWLKARLRPGQIMAWMSSSSLVRRIF